MDKLGIYVVPVAVLLMVAFGVVRRVPVFDTFVEGAKEGLQSCFSILPTLVGLIMAVTMLNCIRRFGATGFVPCSRGNIFGDSSRCTAACTH